MGLKIKDIALDSLTVDPTSPVDGCMWYRSDLDEYRVRRNGVTEVISMASDGGGGGATDLGVVQARRNTSLALTTSWVAMTFDITDTENDATVVEHNNTTTSRIDIKEAGMYEVYHHAIGDNDDSVLRTWGSRIHKNGSVIAGSGIDATVDLANGQDVPIPLIKTVKLPLAVNDYIEVYYKTTSGTPSLNTQALLTVTKLEGVQGAVGSQGADGDITWQGNWSAQNYTVNQAVKYTDGNSYVCKLNTVSSEVPTNATYWDVLAEKGDIGIGAQKRIDVPIFTHSSWKKKDSLSTYNREATFLFGGTTLMGTPSKIYSSTWVDAGTSGKVRVIDLTNGDAVIAEITGISSTTVGNIVDLGTISNLPTGQATFAIEVGGDDVNMTNMSALSVEF